MHWPSGKFDLLNDVNHRNDDTAMSKIPFINMNVPDYFYSHIVIHLRTSIPTKNFILALIQSQSLTAASQNSRIQDAKFA